MRPAYAMLGALVLVFASVAACSSTDSGKSPGAGTTQDGGPGDTDADTSSAVALHAPVITMVMAMTGGLHVMWTNKQTDCDSIEGERKSASEAYKVVFTIPDGSVDNKHDAPLTAGTPYTYRLRCKKGADYSPYSNEKTGTP